MVNAFLLLCASMFALAAPAQAVLVHFVADPINSANECPFCSSATGTGCGAFTLDTVTGIVRYYIVHTQAGETAAHIHGPANTCAGPAPTTAPPLPVPGANPLPLGMIKSGTYGPLTAAQQGDMSGSKHYVNIHTGPCPSGAIRGQIVPAGTTEACCLPDGSCLDAPRSTCLCIGGAPQGPNTACSTPRPCCLPDGTCLDVDPLCCDDLGGTPLTGAQVCTNPEACCLPDGSCIDSDPACCSLMGGTPQGAGTSCATVICQQQDCAPLPDQSACQPVTCPDPAVEQCLPRCVQYFPQTGQTLVLDCDCRSPNECHVDVVVGAAPQCVGGCPPGFNCESTTKDLPDGSIIICCDCVPKPYENWVIADDFCLTPQCPECDCDLDNDGFCTTADLAFLIGCFGPVTPGCEAADLNCDGVVDDTDRAIWQCLFDGNPPELCCPDVAPQPIPITDVQWYGSYLDPEFDPKLTPTPRRIDGWIIGLHRDIPPLPCPPGTNYDACGDISPPDPLGCVWFTPQGSTLPIPLTPPGGPGCIAGCIIPPPGFWRICAIYLPDCATPCAPPLGALCVLQFLPCESGISRPSELIAQWVLNDETVLVQNVGKIGCDQHFIYCYRGRLADGCLVHECADPDEINPAQPGVFHARPGATYWLSIQAEVGHKLFPTPQACCFTAGNCQLLLWNDCVTAGGIPQVGADCALVNCVNPGPAAPPECMEVPTGNTAIRDYWGWHTTPPGYNRKDDAFMGSLAMGCRGEWIYHWMNHLHWSQPPYNMCADDPTKSIDMAFYLICSTGQPGDQGQIVWCQPINPGPPPPKDPPPPARPIPPGNIDQLENTAAQTLIEFFPPGPGFIPASAAGMTRVWRDNRIPINGTTIDTEIVAMTLTGDTVLGAMTITKRDDMRSPGQLVTPPTGNYPVDSFFDVFVEIELPDAPPGFSDLITQQPVRVHANGGLWELPPSAADFQGPVDGPVLLFDRSNPNQPVGQIHQINHRVEYRGGVDIHSDADWGNMPMECVCKGDMNEDGRLNGLDIQGLINCLLNPPPLPGPLGCPCDCADLDDDGDVELDDASLLVDLLLAVPKAVCPPRCP